MQKELLQPHFKKPHAIVFAANDFYVPYLSTLLQSIKDNSSEDSFYDIIILTRDISVDNQQKLTLQLGDKQNFCIRFFDVSDYLVVLKDLQTPRQLTVETYYRLFMQEVLVHYEYALYMDCDMIATDDISQIFCNDIQDCHLAAVRDVAIIAHYNKNCIVGFNKYVKERLGLDSIEDYFQAGLILFNLKLMRRDFVVKDILQLAVQQEWRYQDQDLLNYIMSQKGKVCYLDMRYNYVRWHLLGYVDVDSASQFVPDYILQAYNNARNKIAVIHYAANPKPWAEPCVEMGQLFWQYAVLTPYYEVLMSRLKRAVKKPDIRNNKKLKKITNVFFPMGTKRRKMLMRVFFGRQKGRVDTRN